jgi:hypothetical protein
MPNGPVSPTVAFLLAYVAGLVATWMALGLVVTTVFKGPDTEVPLLVLILPVVGLAVFQLLFGSMTGRWRGWQFWLWAGGLAYGLGGLTVWTSTMGWVGAPAALAGFVAVLGGIGLWHARVLPAGHGQEGGQ